MSCNCQDINPCSSTNISCLCGMDVNIYNSSGVLLETVIAHPYDDAGIIKYVIYNSTAFEDALGQSYQLTIQYNDTLDRWEMSYYNDTIEETIVIGVLPGTIDSCPVSNCWDMDCIAISFNVLGVYDSFFIWQGDYTGNKKSYSFISDWSGSDISYSLSWGLAPTVAGAPTGTLCWILEDVDSGSYAGFLFGSNNCPYGNYVSNWSGSTTRFSFTDLGVSGYDVKSSVHDCGCCDTEIIVTVNGTEYTATVEYDEYGNILGYNGKQYYVFLYEGDEYYVYFNGTNWVIATDCGGAYRITEDGIYRETNNNDLRIIE